ncbi:MAG: pyridoxal phosphate-dependent aminotransferase [Calditrichota bacterium]
MPAYPNFTPKPDKITGSVFEAFLPKMREKGDDMVRAHIGDSPTAPNYSLPIADKFTAQFPAFNRYCNTFGIQPLREALAEKLKTANHLPTSFENIMITSGGTNGLSAITQSILQEGDEILLLTPYWPFFRGMVDLSGAKKIEIPFYTRLYNEPDLNIEALLEAHITPNTAALYLNSPNNPSGKVLSKEQIETIAEVARKHNLWVISDEAYDGMTYGKEHYSIASLPGMFERTFSVFTFSKLFMFAGIRLGYVAAEAENLKKVNRIMVHQIYSANSPGQQMMLQPLKNLNQWSGQFVQHCRDVRDSIHQNLNIKHNLPEGAYYFFFSIEPYLSGRSYDEVINQLMDAGVSVALGKDFGEHYASYIRVCYAAESAERMQLAVQRLNSVLCS